MDEFVDPVLVHCKAMTEKVRKVLNLLYCEYLTKTKLDRGTFRIQERNHWLPYFAMN